MIATQTTSMETAEPGGSVGEKRESKWEGGELLTVMREGAEGSAGSESNSKDNDGMLGMVDRIGNQRLIGKEA